MEEEKREEHTTHLTNSSSTTTTTTTMTFSDKIPMITNTIHNNNISLFPFQQQPSMSTFFDTLPSSSSCDQKASSFGFMDLLGSHDYNTFLSDWLPTTTTATTTIHHPLPSPASSNVRESSEVLNTPASPNSISISSSSNEATVNNTIEQYHRSKIEQAEEEEGDRAKEDDEDKTKKQLKAKKKNQKKQREARFAFMTKSEVDHLDDGYRWRKYGQKAVKNSPYPRSYYRCTTASCGVKKRVERSCEDPSIVVTTYEGQHIHPCPATSRPSLGFVHEPTGFGGAGGSVSQSYSHSHFVLPPPRQNVAVPNAAILLYNNTNCTTISTTSTPPPLSGIYSNTSSFDGFLHNHVNHRGFGSSGFVHETLLRDNGLLQDIIQMKREDKDDSIKGGDY